MSTSVNVSIHPDTSDIRADIVRGSYRCLDIGARAAIFLHRDTLDALQVALDEIRADIDAEEAAEVKH